jgi:predicted TIM-barrel fold metal-dependent hydrolase
VIIDCHNHVLAAGLYPGYERFIKEMTVGYFQSLGDLPDDRTVTDEDWGDDLEYLWEPIDPEVLIGDHRSVGISKSTVLTVAPSTYTKYEQRGTVDLMGVTGVEGPPSIDKANDYMAALVQKYPDDLVGMAAVNPRFRGVDWARDELTRAITELGLTGLKLYPMYDHYAPNDVELGMPIFERAAELGIGVMVHMSTTPVRDAPLQLGWPVLLDDVARRFPELRLLVCHAGFPWTDECLALVGRHENTYLDISYFNSVLDRQATYDFLMRARRFGCNWTKICWATDYPGFEFPKTLLPKFALVNDLAGEGPTVPSSDMARMLGGNWARFAGLEDWSEEETLGEMEQWEERWREILVTEKVT